MIFFQTANNIDIFFSEIEKRTNSLRFYSIKKIYILSVENILFHTGRIKYSISVNSYSKFFISVINEKKNESYKAKNIDYTNNFSI